MKIMDDLVLKKNENVVERFGEDELLLFDSSLGKLFEVNETGKEIWKLCDGKHTVKKIKESLRDEFGDIKDIDKDISDFFNKLLELNLVEII